MYVQLSKQKQFGPNILQNVNNKQKFITSSVLQRM